VTRTRWVALLAALILLVAACSGGGDGGDGKDPADADGIVTGATASPQRQGGTGPLADVQIYSGLSQTHVEGPITYRQTPPVGGDHNPVWLNCGAYDEPVPSVNAVHSMEHGAVWITYRPSLPAGEQETLRGLVTGNPYLVVSPWADDELPSPVVLSAWGRQLGVDSASDPAVEAFIGEFEQGSQTPEPGAPCTGGVGEPEAAAGG
jgi:Protein of unknown function (DUF3105)